MSNTNDEDHSCSAFFGFVEGSGDAAFADDINDCSPTAVHVSIAGCCNDLMQFEAELFLFHAFAIVSFADSE